MNMKCFIIIQEFSYLFSAANAGKIQSGWKLEKKLKMFLEYHLFKDFWFMWKQDSKKILIQKSLQNKFKKIKKNNKRKNHISKKMIKKIKKQKMFKMEVDMMRIKVIKKQNKIDLSTFP